MTKARASLQRPNSPPRVAKVRCSASKNKRDTEAHHQQYRQDEDVRADEKTQSTETHWQNCER